MSNENLPTHIHEDSKISTSIFGGQISGDLVSSSGNTLVVVGSEAAQGIYKTVGEVRYFQNYIFAFDGSESSSTAMLTADADFSKGGALTLASSDKVGITIAKDSAGKPAVNLNQGDSIVLMTVKMGLADSRTTKTNQLAGILSDLSSNSSVSTWLADNTVEGAVNKYIFSYSLEDRWQVKATLNPDEGWGPYYTYEFDGTKKNQDQIDRDAGTIEKAASLNEDTLIATVASVTPAVVVSDVRQIAGSNYVNFRSQMSDVTHRMGELRTSNKDGAWARIYGGKYTLGTGMKEKSITLQIGADRWFDTNSYVGLTAAYTKADDTLTSGDNKQKNWNVGFYGGYVADSGLFVDAIVKHGQIKNDFSLRYESGEPSTGKYHTYGTSASIEGGWRFNCPTTAHYLEPQVELAYGHLQSVTFNAGEVEFQHDAVNSLVGRIGVAAGYKFAEDQGNLYLRTSLLHDFKGEVKTRATAGAETDGGSIRDLGGTWGEFVLGGNYKATKNLNLYGEMMCSTKNAGVRTKWQGSIGARWTF